MILDDGFSQEVADDGANLVEELMRRGYTPSQALITLCAAVATLLITQGQDQMMTRPLREITGFGIGIRQKEIRRAVN